MDDETLLFTMGSTAQRPVEGEDQILADLESRAVRLDRLTASRTPASVADESAQRRFFLLDADGYGLFDEAGTEIRREWLARWALPTLLSYHDAARQLWQYLGSAERRAMLPARLEQSLVGAPISVDWFRLPAPDQPGTFAQLALIEANVDQASLTGREEPVFVHDGPRWFKVRWRRDDGIHAAILSAAPQPV